MRHINDYAAQIKCAFLLLVDISIVAFGNVISSNCTMISLLNVLDVNPERLRTSIGDLDEWCGRIELIGLRSLSREESPKLNKPSIHWRDIIRFRFQNIYIVSRIKSTARHP